MKKTLYIMCCLIVLSLFFSSCIGGGICFVPLGVQVHIQKEDGAKFTDTEMKSFEVITDGQPYMDNSINDTEGKYLKSIQYHLGSTGFEWKVKKIQQSYPEKMKDFWFKIQDSNDVYETFEMKPLNKTYNVVDESVPSIKYTITLKKKH